MIDRILAHLYGDRGAVTLSRDQARALVELATGGDPAGRIADADLIDRLASALAVCLHGAREPEGVDPMAWLQANTALAAAGRAPIPPPDDHRATWLRRRQQRMGGPF